MCSEAIASANPYGGGDHLQIRPTRPAIFAKGKSADLIRALWGSDDMVDAGPEDVVFVSALEVLLGAQVPMFLAWGPDHSFFYNDAFAEVMSLSGASQGAPYMSIFPESWPQIAGVYQQALSGQSVYEEGLFVPLMRQGQLRQTWWTTSHSPVFGLEGQVSGVFGVLFENDRRLGEQKSRAAKAPEGIADVSLAMMWMCDPAGRFVWLNRCAEAVLGSITPESTWSSVLHPDDRAEARSQHEACVQRSQGFRGRYRLINLEGDYRVYEIQASQVQDDDGQIVGWYGSGLEIKADMAVVPDRAPETHLLRQMAHNSHGIFWVLDLIKRDILGVNAHFRDLWPKAGFKDRLGLDGWLSYVRDEDRLLLLASLERAAKGEARCQPFKARTDDGTTRHFHLTAFPLSSDPEAPDATAPGCIGAVVIEVMGEAIQRAYLVEPNPDTCQAIEIALKAEGFRVRVFACLADYQMIVDDLLPGVTLISTSKVIARKASSVTALLGRGSSRPWIAYGAESHRLEDVVQMMKLGAADVVQGCDDPVRIATAAKAAAPTVEGYEDVDQISEARQRISELPRREREVFNGLVEGKTNKLIAQSLMLSPRTVETYRAQMMERLGVRNLSELLQMAALR